MTDFTNLNGIPLSPEAAMLKVPDGNKSKSWSTEFPLQMKKNAKKMTIYQLMLESRLELKSDGQKITCSKVVPVKKKKRIGNMPPALPEAQSRSIYVTAYENAINSSQPHKMKKYFQDYSDPNNITFHVDMNAISPDPNITIIRELKGIDSIVSYLAAFQAAIPDGVSLFWQRGLRKIEHGGREIETEAHMIGTRFYEMEVIETVVPSSEEQQILEEAIFGLASLSQSRSTTNLATNAGSDEMEVEQNSSAQEEPSPEIHAKLKSLFKTKNQVIKNLDMINCLIGDESLQFRVGKPYPKPGEFATKGKMYFILDNNKKITRLKYVLSKPEKPKSPTSSSSSSSSNLISDKIFENMEIKQEIVAPPGETKLVLQPIVFVPRPDDDDDDDDEQELEDENLSVSSNSGV